MSTAVLTGVGFDAGGGGVPAPVEPPPPPQPARIEINSSKRQTLLKDLKVIFPPKIFRVLYVKNMVHLYQHKN